MNGNTPMRRAIREATAVIERDFILGALREFCWNRKRVAQHLQISYRALLYKMKDYGLSEDLYRDQLAQKNNG